MDTRSFARKPVNDAVRLRVIATSTLSGRATQPDWRQSRHPVVVRTRGMRMAITIQATSEWTLTDSPSSKASRWTQLRKNQMASAALA